MGSLSAPCIVSKMVTLASVTQPTASGEFSGPPAFFLIYNNEEGCFKVLEGIFSIESEGKNVNCSSCRVRGRKASPITDMQS